MTQKTEYLFWTLVSEIFHNHSPAVSNIDWRLRNLLDSLGFKHVHRIEHKWDGQRHYYALYSSSDSKRAIKRIYEPYYSPDSNQGETIRPPIIKNPYRGGRVSKVPLGTRERVKKYADDGYSERKIATITGLSRKQVRYILGRK